MRTRKRWLAGAAAGALAAGLIPFVSAPAATAEGVQAQVTPSATSASVGPVRYTPATGTQDPVYSSPLLFLAVGTDDTRVQNDDTIVFDLNTAPSTAAKVWLNPTPIILPTNAGSADDTLSTSTGDDTTADAPLSDGSAWFTVAGDGSVDDTVVATTVAVSAAGVYGGNIFIYDGSLALGATGSLLQTIPFSFTTAGAPATMEVDPASLSLTASTATAAAAKVTVSVKDSNGNLTQLGASNGDAINLITSAATIAAVSAPSPAQLNGQSFDDSTATILGTAQFTVQPTAVAGTATITAQPIGSLPTGGVTAKTVAVTTSAGGAVPPKTLTVTAPTSQILDDTNTDDTKGYDVNAKLVTSLTITGTGATPSASQQVVVTKSGTVSGLAVAGTTLGSSGGTVIATADADGNVNIPVSWTSATAGLQLTFATGTGTATRWVVVDVIDPTNKYVTSPAGSIVQTTGAATSFDISLTDSFGNALVGYLVTGKAGAGAASNVGVTDTSGAATISVPAPSATYTGAASVAFTVLTAGGGTPSPAITLTPVTVTYSASGDISAMAVDPGAANASMVDSAGSTVTAYQAITTPSVNGGTLSSTSSDGYYTISTDKVTSTGISSWASFAITTTPANATTVTVPEGVKVSATQPTSATLWSAGEQTATISAGNAAYVWATKTGSHDITFTSGTLTVTAKLVVVNTAADAYNIALTPSSQTLAAGAIGTATLTVTDVFGNPVDTADDTGAVSISASGEILLAGFDTVRKFTTGADGTAVVTIIAGSAAGTGTLAAKPETGTVAPAWGTTYTAPPGAPAPVTSAAATVSVSSTPVAPSIVIDGTRGTVRGKPGIIVDGETIALPGGTVVAPYIKFPGETSYTQGTARRTVTIVDEDRQEGAFTWQRRTGKKTYVYFATVDFSTPEVRSTRVIIPAK